MSAPAQLQDVSRGASAIPLSTPVASPFSSLISSAGPVDLTDSPRLSSASVEMTHLRCATNGLSTLADIDDDEVSEAHNVSQPLQLKCDRSQYNTLRNSHLMTKSATLMIWERTTHNSDQALMQTLLSTQSLALADNNTEFAASFSVAQNSLGNRFYLGLKTDDQIILHLECPWIEENHALKIGNFGRLTLPKKPDTGVWVKIEEGVIQSFTSRTDEVSKTEHRKISLPTFAVQVAETQEARFTPKRRRIVETTDTASSHLTSGSPDSLQSSSDSAPTAAALQLLPSATLEPPFTPIAEEPVALPAVTTPPPTFLARRSVTPPKLSPEISATTIRQLALKSGKAYANNLTNEWEGRTFHTALDSTKMKNPKAQQGNNHCHTATIQGGGTVLSITYHIHTSTFKSVEQNSLLMIEKDNSYCIFKVGADHFLFEEIEPPTTRPGRWAREALQQEYTYNPNSAGRFETNANGAITSIHFT